MGSGLFVGMTRSITEHIEIIPDGVQFLRCSVHKRLTQHFGGKCVHCRVMQSKQSYHETVPVPTTPVVVPSTVDNRYAIPSHAFNGQCLGCGKSIRIDNKRCRPCSLENRSKLTKERALLRASNTKSPVSKVDVDRSVVLSLIKYHESKLSYFRSRLVSLDLLKLSNSKKQT